MKHFTLQHVGSLLVTLFFYSQISLAQPPPALVWANRPETVSGPDTPTEVGQAIVRDKAGNLYVTGYFMNTVNFGPGYSLTSAGNSDVFIAKYTSAGAILWAKAVGGAGAEIVRGIAVDAADNLYITGQFGGTADFDPGSGVQNRSSNGNTDVFLAKYDNAGNYQWAYSFGSTGQDVGMAVAVDANDNVLVTGAFSGTVNFNPAGSTNLTEAASNALTGFVAQYTSSGSLNWANAFGGPVASLGISVATDAASRVYLTGYFTSSADFDIGVAGGEVTGASIGAPDGFVASYSSSGAFLYVKPFGGNQVDMGLSLAVDATGNAFVTGIYANSADFDAGNAGGEATGGTGFNGFLAKYDPAGNYSFVQSFITATNITPTGIALDGSGNCYLTGYFDGTVDFDPGIGNQSRTSAGDRDIFLANYSTSGAYVYAKTWGSTGDDRSNGLAVDAVGKVFTTGQFEGSVDFDPNTETSILTATAGIDAFVAHYADLVAVNISPAGSIVVCTDSPLSLTATPVGLATTYTWSSNPTGISGTGAVLNTTAPIVGSPTTFTVTVLASDGTSSVSNTLLVTVSNQLPPILNLAASGVLGTNNCSVKLTATATGKAFIFTGPNSITPTDYVFSTVYRNLGQYAVSGLDVKKPGIYRLTAYDGNCFTFAEVMVNGTACP